MPARSAIVGFSVETEHTITNSRKKMNAKNLDLVVVNNPLEQGAGFDVDTNKVTFLQNEKKIHSLPLLSKREIADQILDRVVTLLDL